ncbi:MAG: GT2 family glycosyltransferase [Luteibaculaceae bacterium]|jgi:GT2 family glycosyltransferase
MVIISIHYCGEAALKKTIDSLDEQSIRVNHLIKSADVESLAWLKTSKCREVVSLPDKGVYDALNQAMGYMKSNDIIGFLHAGDTFSSANTLENIEQEFLNNPKCTWLYSGVEIEGHKGKSNRIWQPSKFRKWKMYFGYMPPHLGVFFRKEVFDAIGLFNEEFEISGDYDWLLRLMKSDFPSKRFKEISVIMEPQGKSANTLQGLSKKMREDIKAIRSSLGLPIFLAFGVWLGKIIRKTSQFF